MRTTGTINSLTIERNNIHVTYFIDSKISQYQEHNIKALSEWLGSLQIIEKALEQITKYEDEILTALVEQNNKQVRLFKNMIPDQIVWQR